MHLLTCYTFGTERIYSHREQQRRLKNEQDDRKSKNLQITESFHSGGSGMPLEQDHAVRRQGDRCRLLLQRPRQAILLRCGLRVPTEDTGCEAEIGLREVSSGEFMDEGHAIECAIKNANN